MRKLRALLIASLLLSTLLVTTGPGAGASSQNAAVSHRVRNPHKALEYWTPERMAAARPKKLRHVEPHDVASAAPDRGEPVLVESRDAQTYSSSEAEPWIATRPGPLEFTRTEVDDPSIAPFVTHGVIFGRSNGFGFGCSGTSVSSEGRNLVWTAGHCLYSQGKVATQVVFVPGYEENASPFGAWAADRIVAPPQWVQDEDLEYDFGAFTTVPNEHGVLGDVVGSRGIAFNQNPTEFFESFGYPAVPEQYFDGEHMQTCKSQGSGRVAPGVMAMGCDMEFGSSGGGWIMREGYLASNQSGGNMQVWPNVALGPYLGTAAKKMYDTVRGGTGEIPQPTPTGPATPLKTHTMKVTLNVREHGVAKGRLTAADGFTACVDNAPLTINRLRVAENTYYPIGHLNFTDEEGRFRVKVPDRKGKYLVYVEPGPYDLSNNCTKALGFAVHRH